MKTLLVPTDFSAPAENAMLYAANMARNLNASILLLHVYQVPVSMNDVPVLMVSAEELRENAEVGLEHAKELLKNNYADIPVTSESRLGEVVTEVNDVCKNVQPFAIVVGRHGASGVERLLFGSTALSLIRHISYPVIAVPDTTTQYDIKNIALSLDTLGAGPQHQVIKTFAEELKAKLHVIHVKTDNRGSELPDKSASELNAACHVIRDHEFVHGVQTYAQQNAIDLMVILPHRHSLMERLFFRTHTAELVQKLPIPIMCITEG